MNKDEILEASRKENKKKDLAEVEIENKAVKLAMLAVLILTSVYYCMEIIVKGVHNEGLYSIIAIYCAITYGYKAIKTKKGIDIFCGITWSIVTIMLVVEYISSIFATSTIL